MRETKIIFIKPNDSSFINGDQKIFEKFTTVETYLLDQSKSKVVYGINNLKFFFNLLCRWSAKNEIFVTWFGDYHAAVMVMAAKLTNKKSIIFIGGQEAVCYHELNKGVYRNKFRGKLVGYALRNTDLIIANHQSLIYHENNYYTPENPHIDGIKHYVKKLNTPIEIVYNGISSDRIIRNYNFIKNENLVLTVGTMNQLGDFYNKGYDLFIETARKNPQYEFILIGLNKDYLDWTEENYHVSEIPNLKVIVSFCTLEVLNDCYNKAKVFVQASITEGMPNTLCEAMLMECIPVGSSVNGIPDAIGETGVVINARSVNALTEGIEKALIMNTGIMARQRVLDLFSIEKRAQSIRTIFSKFLS